MASVGNRTRSCSNVPIRQLYGNVVVFFLSLYRVSKSMEPLPFDYIYMGWGESGFNCSEIRWPSLVLFLFYVNVFGMRLRSHFSFQPLRIPTPWVLLRVRWSIPLVLPWVTASRFLAGNIEAEVKPNTFS